MYLSIQSEPVLFNRIPSVLVRTCNAHKKDSDSKEAIRHPGENPLNPKGNCHEYGCICTRWEDCEPCNDYNRSSKRKRKRKKNDNDTDSIISDSERAILKQFRQQEKPDNEGVDIGPI